MQRVSLVMMAVAVAAMLSLAACSNKKGSMTDPGAAGNGAGSTMGSGSGY